MSLQDDLNKSHDDFMASAPEEATILDLDTEEVVRSGVGKDAPAVGDTAPAFTLPDQLGREISSAELYAKGPLVISFYRGSWCPYCSLELHALQRYLPKIEALGASLVAISPQLPDESMSTAEKYELSFTVLSDVGNVIARKYGLVFTLSETIRPVYSKFGIDLPKFNGTDSFELPVPGTFIVDQHGRICAEHVSADYKQRMEPEDILFALIELQNPS
jgi:peroxiredoxin